MSRLIKKIVEHEIEDNQGECRRLFINLDRRRAAMTQGVEGGVLTSKAGAMIESLLGLMEADNGLDGFSGSGGNGALSA